MGSKRWAENRLYRALKSLSITLLQQEAKEGLEEGWNMICFGL